MINYENIKIFSDSSKYPAKLKGNRYRILKNTKGPIRHHESVDIRFHINLQENESHLVNNLFIGLKSYRAKK